MTELELVNPKHPALHVPATINPFDDKDINWEEREKEMFNLMEKRFGIGLAYPQVGGSYKMFVMTLATGENVGVYNPEILEETTLLRSWIFEKIGNLNPKSVTVFLDT